MIYQMGHKYTEQEINLYKTIDEILWRDWDPIGVNDFPEARDEYYAYLPKVYIMAKENVSNLEIANFLFNIATDRMGCSSTLEKNILIADKVIEAKKKYLG